MADHWYFAWGGEKFGPFTPTQLQELTALGKIQPTDTVWKEGVTQGVLASHVKNLFLDLPGETFPTREDGPEARAPVQPQGRFPVPDTVLKLEPVALVTGDSPALAEQL